MIRTPCQTSSTYSSQYDMYNSTFLPPCSDDQGFNSSSDGFNSSSGADLRRERGSYYKEPCGYCNATCIYKSVEMAFVIGIIANILVIVRVSLDKKLRDPTFIGIACLAVADMLFLSLNLTVSFETFFLIMNCSFPSKIISIPYYIVRSTCWFAANAHIALLAVLRYLTLTNPLKASVMLTPTRVVISSCIVWVVGASLMGTLTMFMQLGLIGSGKSREFVIYLWSVVYFMPLLITIILHIIKLIIVRKTIKHTATDVTRRAIRRMSKIVIMVIICAAVLPFPRLLSKVLRSVGKELTGEFGTHYNNIAQLLFLINHFINPFLYGFLSKRFRNSLKQMFSCIVCGLIKSPGSSAETTNTSVTSKKGSVELGSVDRTDFNPTDRMSVSTIASGASDMDFGTRDRRSITTQCSVVSEIDMNPSGDSNNN